MACGSTACFSGAFCSIDGEPVDVGSGAGGSVGGGSANCGSIVGSSAVGGSAAGASTAEDSMLGGSIITSGFVRNQTRPLESTPVTNPINAPSTIPLRRPFEDAFDTSRANDSYGSLSISSAVDLSRSSCSTTFFKLSASCLLCKASA